MTSIENRVDQARCWGLAACLLLLALFFAGCSGVEEGPWDRHLDLDLRAHHPNGTVLRVTALELTSDHVALDVTVVNGSGFPVRLSAAGDLVLADEGGHRHRLAPPPLDPALTIRPGDTIDGRLVFLGGLRPEARRLTLVTNERRGSETWHETPAPKIALEIELPGPAGQAALDLDPRSPERTREPVRVSQVRWGQPPHSLVDVREVEAGIEVSVQSELLFDFDSAELLPEARAALEEVAHIVAAYPGARAMIAGHTDSLGDADHNQRLSKLRAEAVRQRLAEDLHVPADRLETQGFGATRPVAPNIHPDGTDNPEGRRLNRRVEVVVRTADT